MKGQGVYVPELPDDVLGLVRGQLDSASTPEERALFEARLAGEAPALWRLFHELYGAHPELDTHFSDALAMATRLWCHRPADLKALDRVREREPTWFQAESMIGLALYVDLFAGTLAGVRAKIPYLRELGVTYLHLMPLFLAPAIHNDGGYAISSYREVNVALGTMADLRMLGIDLRAAGISLVLDFVFNHTSDEHEWARRAQAGEKKYQDYYFCLATEAERDRYQQNLRDIFPDQRPGSFTYRDDMQRWVWTTFNSFQWDLNYSNPAVFVAMAEEMLTLANTGAEILRMDALAFIWKRAGTVSESLPEAHLLVRAFHAIARIAAPSLLFKSEAIVHPDEVLKYIRPDECRLSYNPLLMALLWEALATGEVRLLHASLSRGFDIDPECSWVNYVRCHDDIGWTFDDATAAELGINGHEHRRFLNDFYSGQFPDSFARGLLFGHNEQTGDARIVGTCASLAGLEQALEDGDEHEIELSIRRVLLLHSVILSIGGIPVLFMGDEVGTLNDYSYRELPGRETDSRWVHRSAIDWDRADRRERPETVEARIFHGMRRLIEIRQTCPALAATRTTFVDTGNPHVLGYRRGETLMVLANFSASLQAVDGAVLGSLASVAPWQDVASERMLIPASDVYLEPYQFVWLSKSD